MDNQDYVIDRQRNRSWPNAREAILWYQARLSALEADILLARGAARIEQAPDWQPIDTAPKDGTPVLLFERDEGQAVGYYHAGMYWAATTTDDYGGTNLVADPSHWKPLGPNP